MAAEADGELPTRTPGRGPVAAARRRSRRPISTNSRRPGPERYRPRQGEPGQQVQRHRRQGEPPGERAQDAQRGQDEAQLEQQGDGGVHRHQAWMIRSTPAIPRGADDDQDVSRLQRLARVPGRRSRHRRGRWPRSRPRCGSGPGSLPGAGRHNGSRVDLDLPGASPGTSLVRSANRSAIRGAPRISATVSASSAVSRSSSRDWSGSRAGVGDQLEVALRGGRRSRCGRPSG